MEFLFDLKIDKGLKIVKFVKTEAWRLIAKTSALYTELLEVLGFELARKKLYGIEFE